MSPTEPPEMASPPGAAQPVGPGEPFRLLFVCTGNTCRSPLAEALARRALARRGWRHVEVRSAGVGAHPGSGASEGAVRVAERHGLDLTHHRSSQLSEELVEWADLVLTMSPGHLTAVGSVPGSEEKSSLITAFAERGVLPQASAHSGIPDPLGGDDRDYEETYRVLSSLMELIMERLEPLVDP